MRFGFEIEKSFKIEGVIISVICISLTRFRSEYIYGVDYLEGCGDFG